jgi:hypothetical protein
VGMFDYLKCHYPLPVEGANALEFQTKDTDAQFIDQYEIRADGTLWHQTYDTEDRSDPNAEGLEAFIGCMTRVNERWERDQHTGALEFYTSHNGGWLEFSALFKDGSIQALVVVSEPDNV